jgi:hypothetical protein
MNPMPKNLMSMLFKLSTVIYTCTCIFMSLTHSLECQCTEKKQTRNRKYTKQFKINVGIKRYTVMSHKGPTRHTCTCKVLNV